MAFLQVQVGPEGRTERRGLVLVSQHSPPNTQHPGGRVSTGGWPSARFSCREPPSADRTPSVMLRLTVKGAGASSRARGGRRATRPRLRSATGQSPRPGSASDGQDEPGAVLCLDPSLSGTPVSPAPASRGPALPTPVPGNKLNDTCQRWCIVDGDDLANLRDGRWGPRSSDRVRPPLAVIVSRPPGA